MSYAYLSLVLNVNETATSNNNIIPFNAAVNTTSVYGIPISGEENLFGYIMISLSGYYMVQYMVQIGNTNNFAMVPIVGSNGNLPTDGITGADFSAYQANINTIEYIGIDGSTAIQSSLAQKSNQIIGNTIYYFNGNSTLSLYQIFPTTPINFIAVGNNCTLAYLLVYQLPSSSWGCFNNLSSKYPPTINNIDYTVGWYSGTYQGNYNTVGSGVALPKFTTTIPFTDINTSVVSGDDDFTYDGMTITYDGADNTTFLVLFMANLEGYGYISGYDYDAGVPGTYTYQYQNPYTYETFPINAYNFGISTILNSTNNDNIYISGVVNPTLVTNTSPGFISYNYPTYQNFQYLSSDVLTLNNNDSFSFNFSYYGNSTVLQNQMYTNATISGTNARSFMFPVTNPYIYLTNFSSLSNYVISNNGVFSFTSYTNNDTFTYDPTTKTILISQPSNVIVYFSITVQNSQVPLIQLNAYNESNHYSNIYSNIYYPYNGNTYPVTGMAIFQGVSSISLTNVSGYDISLALPYNDTINVLNSALFIMTI